VLQWRLEGGIVADELTAQVTHVVVDKQGLTEGAACTIGPLSSIPLCYSPHDDALLQWTSSSGGSTSSDERRWR
jgi:hypothetical protein